MARLTSLFAPKEREFFDLFEEAGENILRASTLLHEILTDWPKHIELAEQVRECETRGDRITHDIILNLNKRFVTPLERDDIYDLASALDDIVDFVEEATNYLGVYQIQEPTQHSRELSRTLCESCGVLAIAIPSLRTLGDVSEHAIEVNRLENEGDRILREAVADLFARETDPMAVIRWKDIYERIEDAIDATETVANIMQGVVIKNT